MAKCYVCNPEKYKLDYYLELRGVPGLVDVDSLFINQNLKGLQELVAVPRTHSGEFRLMGTQWSQRFWGCLGQCLEHLLHVGARNVRLEVSYGDWIVHKEGISPNAYPVNVPKLS